MSRTHKRTYQQNAIKVSLIPQLRYAIAKVFHPGKGEELLCGSPELNVLIREALEARGWSEERIKKEYVLYSSECVEKGKENQFPGGRV